MTEREESVTDRRKRDWKRVEGHAEDRLAEREESKTDRRKRD